MLDFTLIREKKATMDDLASGLSLADLRRHTHDIIDRVLALIAGCTDADVVFQPSDLQAHDRYAVVPDQVTMGWTLGHVIVHTTASSEESAFLAAELARGVENHGRSRYETPWETVTTVAQCRQRLEESRRMRLASLDVWPDEPNLMLSYEPWAGSPPVNAKVRFIIGLRHDAAHLNQIADIVRQAHEAAATKVTASENEGCGAPGCD